MVRLRVYESVCICLYSCVIACESVFSDVWVYLCLCVDVFGLSLRASGLCVWGFVCVCVCVCVCVSSCLFVCVLVCL